MENIFGYVGWIVSLALGIYLFKVKSDNAKEKTLFAKSEAEANAKVQLLSIEVQSLRTNIESLKSTVEKSNVELVSLKEKSAGLQATNESLLKSKTESTDVYKQKVLELESKVESIRSEKDALSKRVLSFEQNEVQKRERHDEQIARLDTVYKQLEAEKEKSKLEKAQAEAVRLEQLKETWSRHEISVEEKIRAISQKYGIEYIDKEKFPHKGKPDNTVKICNEYIVFDSKSPQGEDLGNFSSYIRREAEAAKKYTKNEDVKKDIFLVVPTNAIQEIDDKYRVNGDYRVHVISEDSLEPILLGLQKIEEYEFADQLSPESREKIISVLGKMAHGMKRRIQIDHYFANEFISSLSDAENLPADILEEAQSVERSSKLNPPQEKRTKIIDSKSLLKDSDKLAGKAKGQQINVQANLSSIHQLPLYASSSAPESEPEQD